MVRNRAMMRIFFTITKINTLHFITLQSQTRPPHLPRTFKLLKKPVSKPLKGKVASKESFFKKLLVK
jgi:hypothetical protein